MSERPIPPRQLAVALHYETGTREAPRITAKGQGLLAERIVALARDNGVVIDANPHLAQALSGIELDQSIPLELFEAVAEVIGFVLRAQGKLGEHRERLAALDRGDAVEIDAAKAG